MSEVQSGLEGVVAFATQIAEPDRDGGALRYRGVDVEELAGVVPYERVWGLLVDGSFEPGLAATQPPPLTVHSGVVRVDVQAALALLAADWQLGQLIDDAAQDIVRDPRSLAIEPFRKWTGERRGISGEHATGDGLERFLIERCAA